MGLAVVPTNNQWNVQVLDGTKYLISYSKIASHIHHLEMYLEERVHICHVSAISHFNALGWWKANQLKYRPY